MISVERSRLWSIFWRFFGDFLAIFVALVRARPTFEEIFEKVEKGENPWEPISSNFFQKFIEIFKDFEKNGGDL